MNVTMLYAGALALWFVVLSIRVIQTRVGPQGPELGDGGNPAILRRIRGHANFAEYVPLVLVLMGFLEFSGLPPPLIHVLGAMLLAGRLLHGYALSFTRSHVFGRTAGIVLTLLPLLAAGALSVYRGLASL